MSFSAKLMKTLLLASMILLLGGCMYRPEPIFPSDMFDKELGSLKGQPVSQAINKLGKPDSESSKEGNKVYTWEAVHTEQNVGNECAGEMHQETFVIVDRYPSGESDSDYVKGTCPTHYSISHERCMIKIFTGKDDTITGYDFNGVTDACVVLAKCIDLSYSFVPTPVPWPF
jgi:hypothetical protein